MIVLLAVALKSTLILGGALLLCRSRWLSAAERHLLLMLAVTSLPLLVLVEQLPEKSVTWVAPAIVSEWDLAFEPPEVPLEGVDQDETPARPFSIKSVAVVTYLSVVVSLLVLWLVRVVNTGRWIGKTRALPDTGALEGCRVPLRESSRGVSPLTWGAFAPAIVLPEGWSEWSPRKVRGVLMHELAHVRRWDTLTSMLSGLICCFFWMHPLVWIAHRQIRIEAERACDDLVLSQGFCAVDYAELLLEIARGRPVGMALAIASTSTLPTRIRALLNPTLRRTSMNGKRLYITTGLVLGLVAPLGSIEAVSNGEGSAPSLAAMIPPLVSADADQLPIVKVRAVYPTRARDRGVEGYVLVELTVSETGNPVDVRVIEADPPGVFEQAALQAVRHYRYKPRIVDGEPIAVRGVRSRVAFELDRGGAVDKTPAPKPPEMSEATFARLAAVQSLIEAHDFKGARVLLEHLKDNVHEVNSNEIAHVHNMAGFLEFSTDDYWGAVAEYEQVLAQGDAVPEGLRTQTLYTLAQLNFMNQEYQAALERIRQWKRESEDPGPTPQVFMAQTYYQLQDYPSAIEHLEAGLDTAEAQGVEIKEAWWGLLNYLYYEQKRWSDAIRTLEILNRDFPSEEYRKRLQDVRAMVQSSET